MEKNKVKIVYVLHEFGANSHYLALEEYLCEHECDIKFYEFSFIRQFLSGVRHLSCTRILRAIKNFLFIINLTFTKNKKIVVGIAPLDYRMLFIGNVLKKHEYYYHTSWPYWDTQTFPKDNIVNRLIVAAWRSFFSMCLCSFCVTKTAKESLINNGWVNSGKASVVYHSINTDIFNYNGENKKNRMVFIGRLEEDKGVLELIDIFHALPNYEFVIIGSGSYENKLREIGFNNVHILGFVSDRKVISNYLKSSLFLLLPSKKRVDGWEELFGMVIIESMACGCIPIVTDHIGPQEVLKNYTELVSEESAYVSHALSIISNIDKEKYKFAMIAEAASYSISNVKDKWREINVQ